MEPQSTCSDAEVIQAVLEGNRDAFGILVHRHWASVRAFAISRVGCFADAEDVAQETFLRAFLYLNTLKERARFGSWLMAIAVNVSRKLLGRRLKGEATKRNMRDAEKPVLPAVENRDQRRFLIEEIKQLDETHRDVLLLHYFGGKTVGETAATLAISEEAAKKRLQRARAVLGKRVVSVMEREKQQSHEESEQKARKVVCALGFMTPPWGGASPQAAPTATPQPVAPQCVPPGPCIGAQPVFTSGTVLGSAVGLVLVGTALVAWFGGSAAGGRGGEEAPNLGAAMAVYGEPSQAEANGDATVEAAEAQGVPVAPLGSVRSSSADRPEETPAPPRAPRYSAPNPVGNMARPAPAAYAAYASAATAGPIRETGPYVRRLKMDDVPLRTALDAALRPLNLDYTIENGYIRIGDASKMQGELAPRLETRIYGVRNAGSGTLPKIAIRRP